MNDRGRATLEVFIVTIVVCVAVALAVGIYAARNKVNKGRMMVSELAELRTAIMLYRSREGENPPSLEAVADVPLIDPYGEPYAYDSQTSWVRSATYGYESW